MNGDLDVLFRDGDLSSVLRQRAERAKEAIASFDKQKIRIMTLEDLVEYFRERHAFDPPVLAIADAELEQEERDVDTVERMYSGN